MWANSRNSSQIKMTFHYGNWNVWVMTTVSVCQCRWSIKISYDDLRFEIRSRYQLAIWSNFHSNHMFVLRYFCVAYIFLHIFWNTHGVEREKNCLECKEVNKEVDNESFHFKISRHRMQSFSRFASSFAYINWISVTSRIWFKYMDGNWLQSPIPR